MRVGLEKERFNALLDVYRNKGVFRRSKGTVLFFCEKSLRARAVSEHYPRYLGYQIFWRIWAYWKIVRDKGDIIPF